MRRFEAILRAAQERSAAPQRRPEPQLMFPFSLLQRLIGAGLERLNEAVGRLVKRIIR
jgi:hypothetical protein